MTARAEVIRRYLDYLDACTRHARNELPPFLAETMLVNGQSRTQAEYVADLMATIDVFPDYSWDLRRALVDGQWLAVHLTAGGTRAGDFLWATGDGSRVQTDEFDMYRIVDGLIHEVHGTADNARLCRAAQPT